MSENKRRRKEFSENKPLSENKRPREESVENDHLSENKRPREQSVERSENKRPSEESVENEPLSENESPGEESVQNEPLDLSMGVRKSPDSIPNGLKRTRTSVWDAAAKNAAEKAAVKAAVKKKADVQEETGVTYPIDIWFLIADYIDPENVGKFARICKDTLSVTDTAVFWVRLFKRYCRPTKEFSGKLKPGAVEERFGLRCTVIKALHTMYKPFILKRVMSLKQPDLLYRQVVGEWCEGHTAKSQINYFFELRDITYKRRLTKEDDKEFLKDIAVNPLEGCVLLQVTCPHMLGLPSLLGYILVDVVFVRLQNRMIQMKCTFHTVKGEDKVQIIKVVIGPALSTSVFDWWNPRYPFNLPLVIRHYQCVQKRNIKQEKK